VYILDVFPYFSIFNGDCFSDPNSQNAVIKALTVYNKGISAYSRPALFIRGNHEIRGAFARNLKEMFDFPDNEYFFAMTAGPVRFIFLDCGEDKSDDHREYSALNDFTGYRKKQKLWLKQEVKSAAFLEAKYRILIHHIPLYNHEDRGVSVLSRTLWAPVLDSVPIDVAISGHTHRYNFVPVKEANNNYPVLIGGGKKAEDGTVIVLSANNKQLSIKVLNADGEILGKYKKHANKELKATDESTP
jgi:3',5'-cyclic AMP phosphodiesterase CpdA